eukprot:scaffold38144_cov16-Tisochrysis_lutea.AAC.1
MQLLRIGTQVSAAQRTLPASDSSLNGLIAQQGFYALAPGSKSSAHLLCISIQVSAAQRTFYVLAPGSHSSAYLICAGNQVSAHLPLPQSESSQGSQQKKG